MTSVIQAYQRGLHHLGPVVAESSAPFGLFRRRVRLNAPHPVLVYPQVFPLHRLNFAEGLSCAASGTQRSRTGADHVSSRQYLPGDPIRLIHWRNTAKINRLMVKELEDSVDRTLHLLFDATHVWGDGRETTLEYGIKAVASIAHCAVKNQIPVRILGGGLDRVIDTPGGNSAWRGQTPWPQILEDLALVTEGDGSGLAKSLARVPHGGRVVVAVSVADSSGLEALLRASSMLHRPVVILLEGFGEPSLSGGQLRALEGASTETVVCRPGQLHEVLQALEAPSRPFRSPRRHAVPEAAL